MNLNFAIIISNFVWIKPFSPILNKYSKAIFPLLTCPFLFWKAFVLCELNFVYKK